MYRSVWKNYHKSVCSVELYSKQGIRFHRATGFRYRGYIISDLSGEDLKRAEKILIQFFSEKVSGPVALFELKSRDLNKMIAGEIPNEYSGLKFIAMPKGDTYSVPPLISGSIPHPATGSPVAIICFSRRMDRPCLKTGIVSSRIMEGGNAYVHIEASFEPGNAGSPVIDGSTGNLVGVVSDCLSAQLREYKVLRRIIDENIRTLDALNGNSVCEGIDIFQALKANHYLIRNLTRDIHLCSHRNFGFALPFARIAECFNDIECCRQIRLQEDNHSPE